MSNKVVRYDFDLKASQEGNDVFIEGFANKPVVDDVGDLMKFDDVDLARYQKNPIILYNHDRNLPIGKAVEIKVSEAGLWVKVKLSKSKDAIVSYIRDLVQEGILKTFSIGFEPKQENFNRAEGYNEISKWRLNEISIVTLPANIEAEFALAKSLSEAKSYQEARSLVLKALEKAEPQKPDETQKADEPVVTDETKVDGEGGEKPTEPNPEEEEAKKKEAFQECVRAKVPKLIEEGKPEEQAVAVAMSMCREEGKCDISIMSQEMFDFAKEVAKGCGDKPEDKKPKEGETGSTEGTVSEEKSLKQDQPPTQPPEATPIQTTEDPTEYGNPHLDLMKSMLAMMGKISTQIESVRALLEKGEGMSENTESSPALPPENGEASAKGMAKIAEIKSRCEAIVKSLGV